MKKYGIFEITYRKYGDNYSSYKAVKNMMILDPRLHFAKGDGRTNNSAVFDSPDCKEIKDALERHKQHVRWENSQSLRWQPYGTRFIIHAMNDNKTFAPTKAELKAAIKWAEENNLLPTDVAYAREKLASM